MNWKQIWTVYGKELRDALRDRRTLLSMIAFPSVVIPGAMFAFGWVSFKAVKRAAEEIPAVMIIGPERAPALRERLESSPKLHIVPANEDYARQISEKRIRAAVEIPPGFEGALIQQSAAKLKIYTYEGELKSGFAAGEIERILREYRDGLVSQRLSERDLPPAFIRPFDIQRENVAPPEKVGGNMIGGIIPYLLILVGFIGAMYPAIDLTAGEKERGTMETILCSPVGRAELVVGKFLTVLTASLCTVATSMIALTLSGIGLVAVFAGKVTVAGKAGATLAGGGMPTLDPWGLVGVVVMIIPVAVMFAAVLFTVALFAKSNKEAQTYVSPLMMLTILPAVASILPGVELNLKLALVPILNVSMVAKEMVSGSFPLGMMALIFGSSCLYGAAALLIAVHMFKRESVVFRT